MQIALDAARMLDGHLECVEVRGAPMPIMGDFGGEEAEGGEAFVFPEHIFAFENTGVEPRVLQGDGTEAGEGGAEAFLVVVETVCAGGKHGQHAQHVVLKHHGCRKHRSQPRSARHVGHLEELGGAEVLEPDLPPRVHG